MPAAPVGLTYWRPGRTLVIPFVLQAEQDTVLRTNFSGSLEWFYAKRSRASVSFPGAGISFQLLPAASVGLVSLGATGNFSTTINGVTSTAGSITISGQLEIETEYHRGYVTSIAGFPSSFSGERHIPNNAVLAVYERPVPGSTWRAVLGSPFGTLSGTIGANPSFLANPEDYWILGEVAAASSGTFVCTAQAQGTLFGQGMDQTGSLSTTASLLTIAADYNPGAKITVTGTGGSAGLNLSGAGIFGYVARYGLRVGTRYNVLGGASTFGAAYPASLDGDALDSSGTSVLPFTIASGTTAPGVTPARVNHYRALYSGRIDANETLTFISQLDSGLATPGSPTVPAYGCQLRIRSASASANGEPTNDLDIPLRGQPWDAISVAVAASATIDPFADVRTWRPTGRNTASYPQTSVSGGVLSVNTAVAETGGGTPTPTVTSQFEIPGNKTQSWQIEQPDVSAYRYIEVDIRSTSGGSLPVSIAITGNPSVEQKNWSDTLAAVNTWKTIRIDLCKPQSGGPTLTVLQDTAVHRSYATNDWGVERIRSLSFAFQTGHQFEIRNLRVVRDTSPRWSFMHEASSLFDLNGANTSSWRCGTSETDGRRSAEILTGDNILASSARNNLSDVVLALNQKLGVTALALPQAGLAWAVNQAFSLGGGGYLYPNDGSETPSWVDRDLASGVIRGQALARAVLAPPNSGDVFGMAGPGTGATNVYGWKLFRARANGLAQTPTNALNPGASVTLRTTGGTSRGTGTADARAFYTTGAAYAFPDDLLQVRIGTQNSQSYLGYARTTRRITAKGQSTGVKFPFNRHDAAGRLWVALVDSGGAVIVKRWDGAAPDGSPVQATVASVTDARHPCLWFERTNDRAWVAYERFRTDLTPNRWEAWTSCSDDDGRTWSTPELLMANARLPYADCDDTGQQLRVVAEYVTGTSGEMRLKGWSRGPGDTSWSGPFTLLNSSGGEIRVVDETGVGNVAPARAGHGGWTLVLVLTGETSESVWLATDEPIGRTWSRLT